MEKDREIEKEALSKKDIISYLEEINDRLAAMGKTGEILMSGGAVMTTVYNSRESTGDIDALYKPAEEMRDIIADMADLHKLRDNWLNDNVRFYLENGLVSTTEYLSYDNLTVKVIDTESMLAMKLEAARWNSNDYDDCITLMKALKVNSIDDLYKALDKYTMGDKVTSDTKYFMEKVFDEYKNEMG